ncbi:MAG: signal recognition particle-docking protein FtsY [Ruminococcus sp.]|nr:signal recognition particle-docking protein FtsY [Ruminococcus sp.]
MGLFSKIASGLRKTKDFLFGGIQRVLNSFTVIDEDLFDQLEEQMIMSDIGVETSEEICDRLRKKIKERGITDPKEIMGLIHEVIAEIMGDDTGLDLSVSPAVIMVIGVNGAGKTTTIGKLCHQFKQEGKKVLVAAADTFRAAAIDQLEVWTQRAGVDIVKHAEGSDPGAVVYDALEAAKARECDVVVIDTAGRLHNKKNLMEELKKINRIIDNKAGECSREILLVLDATTGQNAVNQAKLFSETAPITGIVLTKLDGTAKGGIVISIKNELGIPVKLIGVGEKIDDLQPFDSNMFVDALFASPEQLEELAEAEEAEEETSEAYGEDAYEEEEDDDNTAEVDGVKGYYNEYGAFIPYDEDEEEEEYEEESFDEEEAEETETDEYEEEETEEYEEADESEDDTADYTEEADDSQLTDEEESDEDEAETEEEETEEAEEEEETEAAPEPEKKKKRGFFSRLFGGKDND